MPIPPVIIAALVALTILAALLWIEQRQHEQRRKDMARTPSPPTPTPSPTPTPTPTPTPGSTPPGDD